MYKGAVVLSETVFFTATLWCFPLRAKSEWLLWDEPSRGNKNNWLLTIGIFSTVMISVKAYHLIFSHFVLVLLQLSVIIAHGLTIKPL